MQFKWQTFFKKKNYSNGRTNIRTHKRTNEQTDRQTVRLYYALNFIWGHKNYPACKELSNFYCLFFRGFTVSKIQSTLDISNSDILNSAKLKASKVHFDCFFQPLFGVGDFFTCPNYHKCKLICTSGNLNL